MQHLHQYPRSHFLEQFKDVYTFLLHQLIDDVLKSNCSVPVKRAVDARWSSRKEAVSCLKKVISRVVDTLEIWQIRKKHETREEAGLLLSALQTFSFLCFLYMWEPILSEVDITQKYLQQKKIWTLFSVRQRFGIWYLEVHHGTKPAEKLGHSVYWKGTN